MALKDLAPIAIQPARIASDSETVIAVVQSVTPPVGGKDPTIYRVWVLNEVTLHFNKKARANFVDDMPGLTAEQRAAELKVDRTRDLKMLDGSELIKVFDQPFPVVAGRVCAFKGAHAGWWWGPDKTTGRKKETPSESIEATIVAEHETPLAEIVDTLPYSSRCVRMGQLEDKFTFIVDIDQDLGALGALEGKPGKVFGFLQVPSRAELGETRLVFNDFKTKKPMVGFTAGANPTGQGSMNPVAVCCQTEDGVQNERFLLQLNLAGPDFINLHTNLDQWIALGPHFMQGFKASIVCDHAPSITEGFTQDPEKPVMIGAYSTAALDAAVMVERAGFEIDADSIPRFLGGKIEDMRCEEWKDAPQRRDANATVLNLTLMSGDLRGLPEFVRQGDGRCFVVSNHYMPPEDSAKLRALPVQKRVDALLGVDKSEVAVLYITPKKVFAVYVVGKNVASNISVYKKREEEPDAKKAKVEESGA